MLQPRQFQLRCRIVQDVLLPRHPPEPHPQRHQARVLAAEAQRLAVLLPVVKQISLVVLQNGPCDLRGLRNAAIVAPLEEEPEMHAPVLYRVFRVVLHPQEPRDAFPSWRLKEKPAADPVFVS